jgi:hypothetical protein
VSTVMNLRVLAQRSYFSLLLGMWTCYGHLQLLYIGLHIQIITIELVG